MFFPWCLTLSLTVLICSVNLGCSATLATDEVEALKQILETLGKKDWNFDVDPCSQSDNQVICNCSFNSNTTCHVTNITLSGQNLGGKVPRELVRLPYLQRIVLSRNYLNGTIPPEWGTMQKLQHISLWGNHVTGQIPSELANISTLGYLDLDSNQLFGNIPPEFGNFSSIQTIFLSNNYLNGTIPPEWGTMQKLQHIYLYENRVTGRIPSELANISTLITLNLKFNQLSGNIPPEFGNFSSIQRIDLSCNYLNGTIPPEWGTMQKLQYINLESNQLSGNIPPEFGNFSSIKTIVLSSNNLSGELPATLQRLTTLTEFRISDNNFSGNIPKFIGSWTSIETLMIQGSGLSGPIPYGIASMTYLSDLRISDLNGNDKSTLPPLPRYPKLKILILRSCNIIGQFPSDLDAPVLVVLDFSFNKLSGPIPDNFSRQPNIKYIYLTGNLLNGSVPTWMQNRGIKIDLSYNNNLTSESTGPDCQQQTLNLFASSKGNTTGIVSCLKSVPCKKTYYSLHINCGGGEVKDDDNGTLYEKDNAPGGATYFAQSLTNWGFSSTGHFLDSDDIDLYIKTNTSSISRKNPQLYMNARASPLSLSYYGFCLGNGNYTIRLHFAEIMFTGDRTYNSLGRRLFDVYIQGQRVLKDFNIEDEAGGVNIGIVRNFFAAVADNTLDIRFYWAGRGTTSIPNYEEYGPLISAISVNPDFAIPSGNGISNGPENGNSMSVGSIIGIVIVVLFTVLLILSILWWKGCLIPKDTLEQDLKGLSRHTGLFTLRQIRAATNNFDPTNKIGEGGFGPVYKGRLPSDGTFIAVKQLSSKSKQGNREFVNEIGMISALQHPHLVKLYGCCIEGNQLLLVYEYMENNSLAHALFSQDHQLKLDWPTRHKICIGIARGLAYLHEESRLRIVHRDIKATNVLLDKNLNPKISDFGLAKLNEEDNTHISTRVAGTFGYMAPEYAMRGYLTDKADVYSFGIVLLEIVCGRSNTSKRTKEDDFYLLDWAHSLKTKGKLMELVDPRLESNLNEEEVITTIKVALHCTNVVAAERPSMSAVVSMLGGKTCVAEFVSNSSFSIDKVNSSSIPTDVPWTSSSKSISDLYPITLDTDSWED